jgi:hypothetical protein
MPARRQAGRCRSCLIWLVSSVPALCLLLFPRLFPQLCPRFFPLVLGLPQVVPWVLIRLLFLPCSGRGQLRLVLSIPLGLLFLVFLLLFVPRFLGFSPQVVRLFGALLRLVLRGVRLCLLSWGAIGAWFLPALASWLSFTGPRAVLFTPCGRQWRAVCGSLFSSVAAVLLCRLI